MTIKHFVSEHPGWVQTSHQDVYGGQELKVSPGYELMELMEWWQEWKQVMKNMHPSVQDSLQQAKVLHELTKNND